MPTPSGQRTYKEGLTTRKLRWWHESLADFMLSHPGATRAEIAAQFNKTTATVGLIMGSDSFKAYYRIRRATYVEQHDHAVRHKIMNVADKSLDLLIESLDKKRDTIPMELLTRINESALKSLGYGEQRGPQTVVQVNNPAPQLVPVAVSIEDLEAARAALRRSQMLTIEGSPLGGARQALQLEHQASPEAAPRDREDIE